LNDRNFDNVRPELYTQRKNIKEFHSSFRCHSDRIKPPYPVRLTSRLVKTQCSCSSVFSIERRPWIGSSVEKTTVHWSQREMSDPAPETSSGLQHGTGHPLSLAQRGRCRCSDFKLLSRNLTCNEVANLVRQTPKRCTLQKVNNSHTSDSGHALEALCGSFSCAVCRRAAIVASKALLFTRKKIVEGVSSA